MQLSTIVAGAGALFSSAASASPIEARATSINVNPFGLSCTATQCT